MEIGRRGTATARSRRRFAALDLRRLTTAGLLPRDLFAQRPPSHIRKSGIEPPPRWRGFVKLNGLTRPGK
jgi:hypothetical protein